jgi:hypothetical protein
MPGVDDPANSLSRLGDPSKKTKLNMIGMIFFKIGATSKFRMIGSSIPTYKSIHNKRIQKQQLSSAIKVGSLEVDPIEVAETMFAYNKDPWFSDSINVDTLIMSKLCILEESAVANSR